MISLLPSYFSSLLAILVHVLIISAGAQNTQFALDVFVEKYQNPTHRDAAGRCCAGRRNNCRDCNNAFTFCAGPLGQTLLENGACPYGMFSFNMSNSDGITFSFNSSQIVPGSLVPNPMVFHGRDSVPEQFELNIDINNTRGDTQDLVNRYNLTGALTPSTTFDVRGIFLGSSERGSLTLSFRLRCTQNYFGSQCNTYCVPTEQFTCDPANGNIVCREGYQNEAMNCSVCVPATGCNPTNGYCTAPGECICSSGYTGSLCDTEVTAVISPNQGGKQLGNTSIINRNPASQPSTDGSQLSQGGVAGVVIAILLIVALIIVGVVVGILFWMYQPWSNGWFGIEARLSNHKRYAEDAIENPVYEGNDVEANQNNVSPVRGIKYTPVGTQAATNGHNHPVVQTRDDDNPLYASSALERILNPGESDATRYTNVLHKEPPHNVNGNTSGSSGMNPHVSPAIGTLQPESSALERVLMADLNTSANGASQKVILPSAPPIPIKKRKEKPHKRNSLRLPNESSKEAANSHLAASQSVENLLRPNSNFLNPYGEYGDQTLQRAISRNSFSEATGEQVTALQRDSKLFDNPDYEFVNVNSSLNPAQVE